MRSAIPALALVVIAGSALVSLVTPVADTALAPYEGERVVIEGIVVRDPDRRERSLRLTLAPKRVSGAEVPGAKRVLILAGRFTDVSYGDRIRAEGKLRAPETFETDTGRTFDYPRFLFAHGIVYEIPFAEIQVVGSGAGNPVVATLLSVKHALIRGIESALPEPTAALAEGLLLGEKRSLGDRLYDAFVASGLVHIIVLSGYNVALVINAVTYVALRTLPRLAGYALAAFFVIGFAVMTGGSETTVRATIMALFMMVARVLNRPAAALRGLLIAGAIMAAVNPFLVLYDLSFQLSVIATFGLIVFSDGIAKRLRAVPTTLGLREIVSTTLATQITVLPLLVLSIGAVSLVFLPANVLVLPAVPLAMLLGFVAALVSLYAPFLTLIFAIPAYVVHTYIVNVAVFFGTLPFALVDVPPSATGSALIVIASVYALFVLRYLRRIRPPQTVLKQRSSSGF